jgi:iron complex transport system substrate-binding protein
VALAWCGAGCGDEGAKGGERQAGYGDGREIALADGRTTRVPLRAERIVPANASSMDYLAELVDADRVAAVPPTALDYSLARAEPWAALPRFARFASEELLAFDPDLVLVHGWQSRATIARLREAGVCVVELPAVGRWEDVLAGLDLLARAVDEEARGAALRRDLEQRRATLAAAGGGDLAELTVLPYGNFGAGGSTAGLGTTRDLIIGLAGLRNAAAEAGMRGNTAIDVERILSLDPDFVLVGAGPDRSERSPSADFLRRERALRNLRALRQGRVVVLSAALYSTASHHLLDGAEELAHQVREELDRAAATERGANGQR